MLVPLGLLAAGLSAAATTQWRTFSGATALVNAPPSLVRDLAVAFASSDSEPAAIAAVASNSNDEISFKDSAVLRIFPADDSARRHVRVLEDVAAEIDFWTDPRTRVGPIDIRVPSDRARALVESYLAFNPSGPIEHTLFLDNLQSHIDAQNAGGDDGIAFGDVDQLVLAGSDPLAEFMRLNANHHTKYHALDEINAFMDSLVSAFDGIVSTFSIGKTYEGREQRAVKISVPNNSTVVKKQMVFHGGQHAREWIGPAVMQYTVAELLLRWQKGERVAVRLLEEFEFVVIPVLNVDGYVFTHTKNRMWRKNRQPNRGTSCIGTDPNRNWGYKWGGGGASGNPCSESYYGPSAFSAPENKNMAEYLVDNAPNVAVYIDFHAYSQLWMYPFGADCETFADDVVDAAARDAARALKSVHGKSFEVGSICNIIYQAAGSSCDWAYTSANVTFAYAVELRDQGVYGFLLPAKQIIPSGEEVYASIVALGQFLIKKGLSR